jgi:hypothetical protein
MVSKSGRSPDQGHSQQVRDCGYAFHELDCISLDIPTTQPRDMVELLPPAQDDQGEVSRSVKAKVKSLPRAIETRTQGHLHVLAVRQDVQQLPWDSLLDASIREWRFCWKMSDMRYPVMYASTIHGVARQPARQVKRREGR